MARSGKFLLVAAIMHLGLAARFARTETSAEMSSPIKSDEVVLLYPTFGQLDPSRQSWRFAVHGSIYEPEERSIKRAVLIKMLREGLGRDLTREESQIFDRRVRLFLVDAERGKTISVRFGSEVHEVGTSGPDGHFRGELRLSVDQVAGLLRHRPSSEYWLEFTAVTRPGDRRVFAGRVHLLGETGLSVVSDIDDTIKISQVRDRKELLANTFLRPFAPVPGMAELCRALAETKAAFHYVSASPWQLFPPLAEFCRDSGFPAGTFHLKPVRLTDSTVMDLFGSQEEFKTGQIEALLTSLPRRRFILIGDTGEQDPEIFAAVARRHPGQVARVFLRNVTGQRRDDARFREAFLGVPPATWMLFEKPEEIRQEALRVASSVYTRYNRRPDSRGACVSEDLN